MPDVRQYRIVVRGELGELLAGAFEPAGVEACDGRTTLTTGPMDECALYGLLDRFRDFNIELVSLAEIAAEQNGRDG